MLRKEAIGYRYEQFHLSVRPIVTITASRPELLQNLECKSSVLNLLAWMLDTPTPGREEGGLQEGRHIREETRLYHAVYWPIEVSKLSSNNGKSGDHIKTKRFKWFSSVLPNSFPFHNRSSSGTLIGRQSNPAGT